MVTAVRIQILHIQYILRAVRNIGLWSEGF